MRKWANGSDDKDKCDAIGGVTKWIPCWEKSWWKEVIKNLCRHYRVQSATFPHGFWISFVMRSCEEIFYYETWKLETFLLCIDFQPRTHSVLSSYSVSGSWQYDMTCTSADCMSPSACCQQPCQALEYLFKFIVQSRILYSRATCGMEEEQFRASIQELFQSIRFVLSLDSRSSENLVFTQVREFTPHDKNFHRLLLWGDMSPAFQCYFIFVYKCFYFFIYSSSLFECMVRWLFFLFVNLFLISFLLLVSPFILCTLWLMLQSLAPTVAPSLACSWTV